MEKGEGRMKFNKGREEWKDREVKKGNEQWKWKKGREWNKGH